MKNDALAVDSLLYYKIHGIKRIFPIIYSSREIERKQYNSVCKISLAALSRKKHNYRAYIRLLRIADGNCGKVVFAHDGVGRVYKVSRCGVVCAIDYIHIPQQQHSSSRCLIFPLHAHALLLLPGSKSRSRWRRAASKYSLVHPRN